jgi:hypothetical protein
MLADHQNQCNIDDIKECRWRCMNEQEYLMNLLDQFFDRDLAWVRGMLDQHREDGNHKLSLTILEKLNEDRGNLSGAEVTRRGQDMRVWWVMENNWRPILVLQFNFNVMMHFFRLCHGKLEGGTFGWKRLIRIRLQS